MSTTTDDQHKHKSPSLEPNTTTIDLYTTKPSQSSFKGYSRTPLGVIDSNRLAPIAAAHPHSFLSGGLPPLLPRLLHGRDPVHSEHPTGPGSFATPLDPDKRKVQALSTRPSALAKDSFVVPPLPPHTHYPSLAQRRCTYPGKIAIVSRGWILQDCVGRNS